MAVEAGDFHRSGVETVGVLDRLNGGITFLEPVWLGEPADRDGCRENARGRDRENQPEGAIVRMHSENLHFTEKGSLVLMEVRSGRTRYQCRSNRGYAGRIGPHPGFVKQLRFNISASKFRAELTWIGWGEEVGIWEGDV